MTLAMGPGGSAYSESWICDLCDRKFYDRLAPIEHCYQCNLDFCQTCCRSTVAQPIEIATLRPNEARGSANPSRLIAGAQPIYMAEPAAEPPQQSGMAVATAFRPTAPPQPAQEQELPAVRLTLRQGAAAGELRAYTTASGNQMVIPEELEQERAPSIRNCPQSFDEPDAEPENPQLRRARWKPQAKCDGLPAAERATWLVENKGMDAEEAMTAVMKEFPEAFP